MELLHKEITDIVLKTFYEVYILFFLERVYQNAMYVGLKEQGFTCETGKPIKFIIKI